MTCTAPSAIGTTATRVATAVGSRPIRDVPGVRSSRRMGYVSSATRCAAGHTPCHGTEGVLESAQRIFVQRTHSCLVGGVGFLFPKRPRGPYLRATGGHRGHPTGNKRRERGSRG